MNHGGLTIRKEVLEFADAMEVKLRKNNYKRGWDHHGYNDLLKLLRMEVDELEQAILGCSVTVEEGLEECADVGNFAMMIFDRINKELRGIKFKEEG